jgi:DNA-directed RNA polymerase subunit RPC12/RpoP
MASWVGCPGCSLEAMWTSDADTVTCPTCGSEIRARLRPSRIAEYRRVSGADLSGTELKESA